MLKKLLLNERAVLAIILLNTAIIFAQECGATHPLLDMLDMLCTLIFVVEAAVKIAHHGWRNYWGDAWNRFDFIIMVLSIPSLLELLLPNSLSGLETLQVLRTLRILKSFRSFRLFPDFSSIVRHFFGALRKTVGILCSFALLIVIAALLCTSLLREIAPQHFGSVGTSAYTMFRLCTIEGWYEIPESIAAATSPLWGSVARVVFSMLLVLGGIIGMSLINSIFVDEMVSDNDNDLKQQLSRLESKIGSLWRAMENTSKADSPSKVKPDSNIEKQLARLESRLGELNRAMENANKATQQAQLQNITHNINQTPESSSEDSKNEQSLELNNDINLPEYINQIEASVNTIQQIAKNTNNTNITKQFKRIETKQNELLNIIPKTIDALSSTNQIAECEIDMQKLCIRINERLTKIRVAIDEIAKIEFHDSVQADMQKKLNKILHRHGLIKNKFKEFRQIIDNLQ